MPKANTTRSKGTSTESAIERTIFCADFSRVPSSPLICYPAEIAQSVKSVRELYQDKKITVIFQPHLYTRTRDFYRDFADSLSLSDEVILTEIYPAREQPIPGVTSQLIYDNLHLRHGGGHPLPVGYPHLPADRIRYPCR